MHAQTVDTRLLFLPSQIPIGGLGMWVVLNLLIASDSMSLVTTGLGVAKGMRKILFIANSMHDGHS